MDGWKCGEMEKGGWLPSWRWMEKGRWRSIDRWMDGEDEGGKMEMDGWIEMSS